MPSDLNKSLFAIDIRITWRDRVRSVSETQRVFNHDFGFCQSFFEVLFSSTVSLSRSLMLDRLTRRGPLCCVPIEGLHLVLLLLSLSRFLLPLVPGQLLGSLESALEILILILILSPCLLSARCGAVCEIPSGSVLVAKRRTRIEVEVVKKHVSKGRLDRRFN